MDFTREPIIETIIAPRDGCSLIIRNTKGGNYEEYIVDSIEVVCFGKSYFFRSSERSKSFLLPVSDYEVLETKDTMPSLKIPGADKSSKPEKKIMQPHREESRASERKPMKRREPRKRSSDHNESGHSKWHSNRDEGRANLIPPPPDLISKKYHRDQRDNQNKSIHDGYDTLGEQAPPILDNNEIYELELGREIEPLQHQVLSNEIVQEDLPHSTIAVEDNLETSDNTHSQMLLKPIDE